MPFASKKEQKAQMHILMDKLDNANLSDLDDDYYDELVEEIRSIIGKRAASKINRTKLYRTGGVKWSHPTRQDKLITRLTGHLPAERHSKQPVIDTDTIKQSAAGMRLSMLKKNFPSIDEDEPSLADLLVRGRRARGEDLNIEDEEEGDNEEEEDTLTAKQKLELQITNSVLKSFQSLADLRPKTKDIIVPRPSKVPEGGKYGHWTLYMAIVEMIMDKNFTNSTTQRLISVENRDERLINKSSNFIEDVQLRASFNKAMKLLESDSSVDADGIYNDIVDAVKDAYDSKNHSSKYIEYKEIRDYYKINQCRVLPVMPTVNGEKVEGYFFNSANPTVKMPIFVPRQNQWRTNHQITYQSFLRYLSLVQLFSATRAANSGAREKCSICSFKADDNKDYAVKEHNIRWSSLLMHYISTHNYHPSNEFTTYIEAIVKSENLLQNINDRRVIANINNSKNTQLDAYAFLPIELEFACP